MRVFDQKIGSVTLYLERWKIFLLNKYLDTFKSLLFYFHTFGVRRSIDVPPSENKSGSVKNLTRSGVVGLKEDV